MSEPVKPTDKSDKVAPTASGDDKKLDSFGRPVEKSPFFIYALLQIPMVIIMAVILYFMYQARQN